MELAAPPLDPPNTPVRDCGFCLGFAYYRLVYGTLMGMETGLAAGRARSYVFYDWRRAPLGLSYYLLVPPHFTRHFPFVEVAPELTLEPPPDYYLEGIVGLLPSVPLLLILLGPSFGIGLARPEGGVRSEPADGHSVRPDEGVRRLAVAAFGGSVLVTVAFGATFSLVGYSDWLKENHSTTYEAIQSMFGSVPGLVD